jgi:hypothetical protein
MRGCGMHTKNLVLHRSLNKDVVPIESGMFLTEGPAGIRVFDMFQCWYQLIHKKEAVE